MSSEQLVPLIAKHNRNILDPWVEKPFYRIASTGESKGDKNIHKKGSHDIDHLLHKQYIDEFQPVVTTKEKKRKVNIANEKGCCSFNIKPIKTNKDSKANLHLIDDAGSSHKEMKLNGKSMSHEKNINKSKSNYKLSVVDSTMTNNNQLNVKTPLTRKLTDVDKPHGKHLPSSPLHTESSPRRKKNEDHHHPKIKSDKLKDNKDNKDNGALNGLLANEPKKTNKKKKRGLSKHKSIVNNRNFSTSKTKANGQSSKKDNQVENLNNQIKIENAVNIQLPCSLMIENLNMSSNQVSSKLEPYVPPVHRHNSNQSAEVVRKKPNKKSQFSFCSLFACINLNYKN